MKDYCGMGPTGADCYDCALMRRAITGSYFGEYKPGQVKPPCPRSEEHQARLRRLAAAAREQLQQRLTPGPQSQTDSSALGPHPGLCKSGPRPKSE